MYNLDENFLKEVGLDGMPEHEKGAFLEHLQEELEVRVGEKMSEGLSEAQIDQFEKIIDGDKATIEAVLADSGDYRNDETYKKLIEIGGYAEGSDEALAELASIKWLEKNRPDYQNLVENASKELKAEVIQKKDAV